MSASLILRTVKGSPLTNLEVDNNFSNLNIYSGEVDANIGVLSALTTTDKSNIVFAVNEVKASSALTSANISQFAIGTSADLAAVISNETGTGNVVFSISPTLVAPILGEATGTSVMLSANVGAAAGNVSGNFTAGNFQTAGNVNSSNLRITTNSTLGTVVSGTWNGSSISTTYTDAKVTAVNAGTGISVNATTGSLTVTNSGVTSAVAGTGVSVSAGTGAVTFSIGQAVATSSNTQFNSLGVGTAGSGTAGEIRATNNITAYYSDDRLKTRLGSIVNALEKVCQLSGFYYEANETAQALGYERIKEVGVSAQEVQRVLPEVVVPAPIDEKYLTVRYEKIVPLLIEAIKELNNRIDVLQGK